jgi:hypothetical protein
LQARGSVCDVENNVHWMNAIAKQPRPGFFAWVIPWAIFGLAGAVGLSAAHAQNACQKIVLMGDVSAGRAWKAPIGQGWFFRVIPIQSPNPSHTGWDLVVDRDPPAGFPDALLLATPPYNSINEREVGTTFGLRAQDAIGWNPRSFRFVTDPHDFEQAQAAFLELSRPGGMSAGRASGSSPEQSAATRRLLALLQRGATGEFRILDAHLAPGIADATPYAERWAQQSMKTQQSYDSPGAPTPLGQLHWIRFSITLWLPATWKLPPSIHATPSSCTE